MANHLSAKKRIRQNIKKREYNRKGKSRMRTFIRRVEEALLHKKAEDAQVALKKAMSELHRAVTKGIIPTKTADRKISRLNRSVKSLVLAEKS